MSLTYDSNLITYTDVELVDLARKNDEQALACLYHRYAPLLRSRASSFIFSGIEYDDLFQDGMIGFLGAIRVFDSNASSFSTFAKLCIDRILISSVRSTKRQKHIPNNKIVNLDGHYDHFNSQQNSSESFNNPESIIIAREEFNRFKTKAEKSLSKMEYMVLCAYLKGCNYEEIARQLNKTVKSVDNALQRIRRKLR